MQKLIDLLIENKKIVYKCECFEKIGSTNDHLKMNVDKYDDRSIIMAKEQTNGRGRNSKVFLSQKNQGLFFSILYKNIENNIDVFKLSGLWGLVIAQTLSEMYGLNFEVKWINDVEIFGYKIAGILCECLWGKDKSDWIIGVGINLENENFDGELKEKAISLKMLGIKQIDREELLRNILVNYEKLKNENWIAEYRKRSSIIDKNVIIRSQTTTYECRVIEVKEDGSIKVEKGGKEEEIREVEISLKKVKKSI